MKQPSTRVLVAAAVTAAAVLGVVGGIVLEDRQDLVATTPEDTAAAPVTVGGIDESPQRPSRGSEFELSVYNSSGMTIRASVASLEGAADTVRGDPPTAIEPGTWDFLGFKVTVNCDTGAPNPIHSAVLTVGDTEHTLPLPGQGKVLVDYHRDLCRTGQSLSPGQLVGVWALERVYGEEADLIGIMLWRFDRDGAFAADPEGGLFTRDTALYGTYRLQDELLTIDVDGGYGCGAAGEVVWQVARAADRLTLAWLRGTCPDGEQGDLWVMRRVLSDAGLPASSR